MKANKLVVVIIGISIFQACQMNNKKTPHKDSQAVEKKTDSIDSIVIKKKDQLPVYGIDISMHQDNEINSIYRATDSISFVICKATEGITYTDPKFNQNWETIKKHGFIRGAYHFYRSQDDPVDQALNFLAICSKVERTDFPPIVDFEETSIDGTPTKEKVQSDFKVFMNIITKESKRTPIIYTDVNIGNEYLDTVEFSKYPLWIANYSTKSKPHLPKTWKDKGWLIWQRSIDYKIGEIKNDFDIYNGNLASLKEFIKNSNKK